MFKIPVTLACILLILYALRLDRKESVGLSPALWIPTIWLMIVASRPVSFWFSTGGYAVGTEAVETGSPIDRTVFSILLVASIWCLARRKLPWGDILHKNRWFVALIVFAGVSLLWSDYPFVSFKRWVRGLGAAAAALIVVTEKDQFAAIRAVFRRVAFLLLPLSVLTIRYYREIGVAYGYWGGMMYTGVTTHKNILGRLSLLSILYFVLSLMRKEGQGTPYYRHFVAINALYLATSWYLLSLADSATAFAATLIGLIVFFGLKFIGQSTARVNILILICFPILVALLHVFEILPVILGYLERDETFTGRTDLWELVLAMKSNVLLGAGYGGFWIGERLEFFWQRYWWAPTSAHNGYLEVFLELGLVGILLLFGCLASAYRNSVKALLTDFFEGRFYLSLFLVFLIYNLTETATSLNSMMWFVLTLFSFRGGEARIGHSIPVRSNQAPAATFSREPVVQSPRFFKSQSSALRR